MVEAYKPGQTGCELVKKHGQHPAQPPRLADKALEWFLISDLLETVQGDLHEEFFYRVRQVGERKGNSRIPFPGENSVILTASSAKRYFNDQDPVGKALVADGKTTFVVSGVVADFPDNSSSVHYDILFSMDLYAKKFSIAHVGKSINEDSGNFNYTTFLQLDPRASKETASKKLAQTLVKISGTLVSPTRTVFDHFPKCIFIRPMEATA